MIIEFNVFFLKEEDVILSETGKQIAFEDCILKKMGFMQIDNFYPRSDRPNYTVISSGGDVYTSNEPYEKVKKKIETFTLLKFN